MIVWTRDPRRVALALLTGLHVGMALAVPGEVYVWDQALLHMMIPAEVRVGLWVAAATLCGIGATSRRWQHIGFGAAMVMPVERVVSHMWAWVAWVVPGVPSGQPEGIGYALVWACLAALIIVLAGTRTAPAGESDGR